MKVVGSRQTTGSQEWQTVMPGARKRESVMAITDAGTIFRWEPIIAFYCIYIGIIFIGGIAGIQTTEYGAAIFLFFLYARYGRYLYNLRINFPVICILFIIFLPLITMTSFDHGMLLKTWRDLIKYWALIFVMLIGLCLPLTPLPQAKRSWLLYTVLLVLLISGWIWQAATGLNEQRVKGFLVNPNGFALTAMMLLLLMHERRKRGVIRGLNHMIVLSLIYVSHTSGALIAYAAGMLHRFFFTNKKYSAHIKVLIMFIAVVAAAIILIFIPPNTFSPLDTTIDKIKIARENIDRVLSNKPIEYYEIIERQGRDVTSGLWRLDYWHHLWIKFWASSPEKIMFGHGIGTTTAMFKMRPHNDYLRLLLETGIVGFLLFMTVWIVIYRNMEVKYRWAVIMVAIFCITENNYDHFPAMSLLVLYMLGAKKRHGQRKLQSRFDPRK